MKIFVVGDVHWCQNSSIVRKFGNKYSVRLENLIESINWAEEKAKELQTDLIIYLGDFFDTETLNSIEISALKEINWASCSHVFLCGNHEMGFHNLQFNSADIFNLHNFKVISVPEQYSIGTNLDICFLPYILESDRKDISEYFDFSKSVINKICFSHNDLLGLQMGQFVSKTGFDLEDISTKFLYFINGHLHNGSIVRNNVLNLGNLSGQNFSEDATKYAHKCLFLETDNKGIVKSEFFENPSSLNFYKFDYSHEDKINAILTKDHAIVSITCNENNYQKIKDLLESSENVLEYRLIVKHSPTESIDDSCIADLNQVDHLAEFQKYILETLGSSEVILSELNEVIQ